MRNSRLNQRLSRSQPRKLYRMSLLLSLRCLLPGPGPTHLLEVHTLPGRTAPVPGITPDSSIEFGSAVFWIEIGFGVPEREGRTPGGASRLHEALRALHVAEEDAASLRRESAALQVVVDLLQEQVAECEVAGRASERDVRFLTADATLEEWGRAIGSAISAVHIA